MKPREFWLCYDDDKERAEDWFTDDPKNIEASFRKQAIHVIEKSAYDRAIETLESISRMYADEAESCASYEARKTLDKLGIK